MVLAFDKPPDEQRIVALLAKEGEAPLVEVAALYAEQRAALASGAKVSKFLHILAMRRVHDMLSQRRLAQQPPR